MFPYEVFFEDFLRWIREDIPYFDLTDAGEKSPSVREG